MLPYFHCIYLFIINKKNYKFFEISNYIWTIPKKKKLKKIFFNFFQNWWEILFEYIIVWNL